MADQKVECKYKKPMLTIKLPKSVLLKYTATTPNNMPFSMGSPKQLPAGKSVGEIKYISVTIRSLIRE